MKKILLCLTLLLGIGVFSSCSEEVDEVKINDIVGLWTFVNYTIDVENPTNQEELEYEKAIMALASVLLQGTTIDIKPNGTLIFTAVGESIIGSYIKDGDKFSITIDGETVSSDDVINSRSYIKLEGNVLTITSDNLDTEYRARGFTKYLGKIIFKK